MYTPGRRGNGSSRLRQRLDTLEAEAKPMEVAEVSALEAQIVALKQVNELLSRELWDVRQDRNYWREAHLAAQRHSVPTEPKLSERKMPAIVTPPTRQRSRGFWRKRSK